ncbi:MAG: metabolite traffic protein EboE [Nitrospirales bacterium]|nr:metabolite traffic protein EboE [Nitrospirales bacterium]
MITYCTNIHPGESWQEVFSNISIHTLKVKEAVSPDEPFPIGLRLSNIAAQEIDEYTSKAFMAWCIQNDCYVPTINGFPYGSFHNRTVKENVYLPDWRSRSRADYTKRLADLLDEWLPGGITGSISTVPVGFRNNFGSDDFSVVRQNLLSVIEHFDSLRQKSGKEIILSLEPEPGCVLESTEDAVQFFQRMGFPKELQDCIGLCFDCCHMAVEFENPAEALSLLSGAGIRTGKVQVSSALRLKHFDRETVKGLSESCYLHQVVIRDQRGTLTRYNDIPEAISKHKAGIDDEECRIHFHVPIFIDRTDCYDTTRFFIEETLTLFDRETLLEVETYTWQVLPKELQKETVTESIIREICWLKEQLYE